MKLLTLSKQSIKAIFANKGRTILTILGIVIGIGSVIALMSLGAGVKTYISGQISTLGATTLTVTPGASFAASTQTTNSSGSQSNSRIGGGGSGGGGGEAVSTLTVDDLNALKNKTKNPDLALVSGSIDGSAVYNSQRLSVHGTAPDQFQIIVRTAKSGRVFSDQDVVAKNKVMDLGYDLANNLFGSDDPIGKTIQIGTDNYTVIGVLDQVKETSFQNPNLNAFIPYSAAMDSLGTQKFSNFSITAKDENSVSQAKTEIQDTLLANHNIKDIKLADFSVFSAADLLSTVGNVTTILTSLLSGIAAISLLVGGIGIMNIMLVSVTERTREIGLRKAVGAKTSDILVQFLIEAILLTLTGGILGIALGAGMAKIAGHFIGFPPQTTMNAILLAVGISTLVGLIFGLYPAARASRLNPIDALRYE